MGLIPSNHRISRFSRGGANNHHQFSMNENPTREKCGAELKVGTGYAEAQIQAHVCPNIERANCMACDPATSLHSSFELLL
jgi:hypothetical protein